MLFRSPNFPYNLTDETQPRKPDATLICRAITRTKRPKTSGNANCTSEQRKEGKVIFLDFARTTGNTQQRLTTARQQKYDRQYKDIVDQLNSQDIDNWNTCCYILNASYAAAIDVEYWTNTLSSIGIQRDTIHRVLKTAMKIGRAHV